MIRAVAGRVAPGEQHALLAVAFVVGIDLAHLDIPGLDAEGVVQGVLDLPVGVGLAGQGAEAAVELLGGGMTDGIRQHQREPAVRAVAHARGAGRDAGGADGGLYLVAEAVVLERRRHGLAVQGLDDLLGDAAEGIGLVIGAAGDGRRARRRSRGGGALQLAEDPVAHVVDVGVVDHVGIGAGHVAGAGAGLRIVAVAVVDGGAGHGGDVHAVQLVGVHGLAGAVRKEGLAAVERQVIVGLERLEDHRAGVGLLRILELADVRKALLELRAHGDVRPGVVHLAPGESEGSPADQVHPGAAVGMLDARVPAQAVAGLHGRHQPGDAIVGDVRIGARRPGFVEAGLAGRGILDVRLEPQAVDNPVYRLWLDRRAARRGRNVGLRRLALPRQDDIGVPVAGDVGGCAPGQARASRHVLGKAGRQRVAVVPYPARIGVAPDRVALGAAGRLVGLHEIGQAVAGDVDEAAQRVGGAVGQVLDRQRRRRIARRG